MRSLLLTAVPLVLLAVASLTLISGCGQWLYADKVISVGEHELTVAKGLNETVEIIEIAPDVEVVLDGEPAALQDIRPGDLVKVTKQAQGEQEFAVKIEAKRVQEEDAAEPVPAEEGHSAEPAEEVPVEDLLFVGVITFLEVDRIRVQGDAESDDAVEGVFLTLTDETGDALLAILATGFFARPDFGGEPDCKRLGMECIAFRTE